MKRDLDLIRGLMLHLEQATKYVTDRDAIDGYSRDKVAYHLALIIEADFAEGQPLYSNTGGDPTIPHNSSTLTKRAPLISVAARPPSLSSTVWA
jgi:hypothetical protein